MKKVKKLLCALLAMCMVFALMTACNEGDDGDVENQSTEQPSGDPTGDGTEPGDDDTDDVTEDYVVATVGPNVFMASQLVYMTDFSDGLGAWEPRCGGTDPDHEHYGLYEVRLDLIDDPTAPTGGQVLHVNGRDRSWNGMIIDLTEPMHEMGGFRFEILAWVRVDADVAPFVLQLSRELHNEDTVEREDGTRAQAPWDHLGDFDDGSGILSKYMMPWFEEEPTGVTDDYLYRYPEDYVMDNGWVLLHGSLISILDNIDDIFFYIESRGGSADFYVDSFYVFKG